ncbi:unnamed protein product [Clavelina lepadiformis]|uniref:Sodium-coupled monocarboxylate transporter 1 n=1 Tax=Clavelina lepadiformis TaxID=159417 RepID=A0ABP0FUN0_CLALP
MDADKKQFGIVDFVVFIGLLVMTMLVGIYHAYRDRKKSNLDNYYFGGRNMPPIPVGLSISVTFISAMTVIGYPTETYLFGTVIGWFCFVNFIPTTVACVIYIPLVHRLKLASIYEYLELRFHKSLRQMGSIFISVAMIVYMGLTIYIPALALNAVTPLDLIWTIILGSGICTIYTALGGMKAVVWTDTLQTCIMLAGSLAALIKATTHVGGFHKVWAALDRGGRLNFFNFNPDPTLRNSFWTIIVGTAINFSNPNQAIIQRYMSCSSVKKARTAALVAIIPSVAFILIAVLTGCAMYAYYEGCDPLLANKIQKVDQMMPYLVVDIFQDVPGMAGLFVSAGFSGTLSTVSSGINSLASLAVEDFILVQRPKIKSTTQVTISKIIVVVFGFIVMSFALSVQYFGGTVTQIGFTLAGILGGPLLAVFTLGLFFPWTNTKGALIGQITSTVLTATLVALCLAYGVSPIQNRSLPASTDECVEMLSSNATDVTPLKHFPTTAVVMTTTSIEANLPLQDSLFAISYIYFGAVGFALCLILGLFVSFATGANKPSELDPKLFIPLIENEIFPASVRKFFRFGVPPLQEESFKAEETELKILQEYVSTESEV